MREMPGFPVYKVKLGTKQDIEIMQALRKNTDAVFRIDANQGWTVPQAIYGLKKMAPLGIQFCEQPVLASDTAGLKAVRGQSPITVMADEALVPDPAALVQALASMRPAERATRLPAAQQAAPQSSASVELSLPEGALILLPTRNVVMFPGAVTQVALARRRARG